MGYLAHISEEKGQGSTEKREQTIKEHLEGTARLAEGFALQFDLGEWGYCCGLLHDIGKYSEAFQRYINNIDDRKVDHSTAGAQVCEKKGGLYKFLEYCIAGHHAGLADYGSTASDSGDSTLCGRLRKKVEDYSAYQTEIKIPELGSYPFDPKAVRDPSFSLSVFMRMIFSCLVDADYLDTEKFMKDGKVDRDPGEDINHLLDRLNDHIFDWLSNKDIDTVNGRRTEILKSCLEHGNDPRGLFRLTVPTGGGKTIASLAFALRHAVKNDMSRIIYVIPYTSIIEQNARIFKDILGEGNVLEDHYNADYKSSEELSPMYLASENWDKPVIVTTNVQFFESLFSNKPSKCRKLHNIANSVIIFDEAQMLPNDFLKPCISMMEELIINYKASIVLCTATQPALQQFFSERISPVELCPRIDEQFSFFKRVSFNNIGTITEEDLISRLHDEHQALCIVNTRKRAQSLYFKLKEESDDKGEDEYIYHLSTCMYPRHRKEVLDKIREQVKEEKRCIVISTSLVEAGVDLDFKSVYRQLAGTDSIIQAAGRCNREGKRPSDKSIVSIFRFEDGDHVPAQSQQINITKVLMKEGKDISSRDGIEEYFKRLYHVKDEALDKKGILKYFAKAPCYDFASAAKNFKLIDNSTITVFISNDDESKDLLFQMKTQGFSKRLIRKAGQYCVQVYEKDFTQLYDAGMLKPISEELEDFYILTDEKVYSDNMGLKLGDTHGMAMFA